MAGYASSNVDIPDCSPLMQYCQESIGIMATLSETIAEYFCQLTFRDIPEEKMADIRWLILDYLGVACRGSSTLSGRIAIEYVTNQKTKPLTTIIGSERKAIPMLSAFANAISSHSIELDDVDDIALYHFSPSIVSAAIASAEMADASGKDFLTAVYAGCEMMARLSNAMNPSLRNRGFHTTPVCGTFGATVSGALLLGLTKEELVCALGLAGAQCCGLMEMYGESMQKRFNPGPAARNGIMAAEMAQLGYTGTNEILEGKRGVFKAFSDQWSEDAFLEGLGKTFPVYIEFKPYSAARPIHNGIDCVLEIQKNHSLDPAEIRAITIYRHPDWAHYHVNPNPRNINEAQVSLPYSVAVAFQFGDAFLERYDEPFLSDPEVRKLMDKVHIDVDSTLPRGVSCLMVVETEKSKSFQSQVDFPKGSKKNPLTDDELKAKFRRLSASLIDSDVMDRVVATVSSLEDATTIKELTQYFQKGHNNV
jgi:2-methylcitrate dehydratase PrpD